jgi:hypothetical protein
MTCLFKGHDWKVSSDPFELEGCSLGLASSQYFEWAKWFHVLKCNRCGKTKTERTEAPYLKDIPNSWKAR